MKPETDPLQREAYDLAEHHHHERHAGEQRQRQADRADPGRTRV